MFTAKQRNYFPTLSTAMKVLNVFCVLKKEKEKQEKLLRHLAQGRPKLRFFYGGSSDSVLQCVF